MLVDALMNLQVPLEEENIVCDNDFQEGHCSMVLEN
jgi:hypothetical protein